MPEQPPKFICELCGAGHPTAEHEEIIRSEKKSEDMIASLEKELSPEIIEQIMNKVEDINHFGIAFHTIGANRQREKSVLEDVLKDGILGLTAGSSPEKYKKEFDQRKTWVTDMRKRNELPMVWFDVLGDYPTSAPTMKDCYWLRANPVRPLNVTIIFDLAKFNDPVGTHEEWLKKLKKLEENGSLEPVEDFIKQSTKLGNYMPADTKGPAFHGGEFAYAEERRSKKARGGWDSGRVLFGRIPSRYFRGIVIQYFKSKSGHPAYNNEEETDPKIIQKKVDEIVSKMITFDKDKPHLLLPIYDSRGNLLWPKQMRYEQVQKFVAEKLKSKEQESQPAPPVPSEQAGKKEGG